ncbi:PREDICTED: bestrophin homolog 15 isoform X1 [Polistes dominula]|uniref:Bestrophin homolog 15 isoform X1 n=2 Tax=Polistes dominula TaxID=743375 RepID=A0ABM1I0U7_POLDO|nr:PREDICTED: bestrophin homolog 15 isoform X1 [Polistes dominula]
MTISYASEVPNGSSFGCFWRILVKWRGSVYKLIWRELLAYLFVYYLINFTYRYALNEQQRAIFEKIRYYFGNSSESIPMSFVLGFYVSLVVKRWWEQYKLLPWPDNLALFISAAIPGNDERGRLMRRNIVRYAVLAYVITLQRISLRVKRRFPTLQHIVDVGLMMESEKKIFEMMNKKAAMSKYWMPLVWATNIINRARKEALITSDQVVQTLLVELSDIRKRLGALIGYDTVCVPLVYTQVVTLSLYAYFFSALLGRQFIERTEAGGGKYEEPDMYFPFFTALQFCFYVGWLKVAEVLINPFGEDDDDIELNWLIDRHIKAGYMIVDEMHEEHPELLKDQYWDEVVPRDLPYTVASEQYRREEPKGSAEHYKVKESDALYANVMMGTQIHSHVQHRKVHQDDMYADYESVDTPLVERRKNWLQRQITRMGSVRSSSTTYSSGGGFFARNRHNSVYSSPETGGLPTTTNPNLKMSLYDRLVGRKSIRSQRMGRQGTMTKLNSVPVSLKNRPRIPTPDVTKEVVDREQRLALSASNTANIGAGVVGVIPANGHYTTDLPVVQVVLSPIQETEGTPSNAKSGAAALAQAVLSPTLTSAGLVAPVTLTPVTMSQLTQLGLVTTTSASSYRPTNIQNNNTIQATLTEVNSSEEEGSGSGSSSSRSESIIEQEERSTPLIGENTSPNISNGGSPTFDSYNDRSPILMNPEKLSYVVALPTTQESHLQTAIEPRGRRSASLPGPPVVQLKEDRSMSLPHSPGLQPRETRAASVSSRNDHPNLDRLAIISPNHDLRPRTNSFGHELTKNNQQRNQETSRKISSASCNNAAITTAPVVPNQTTATPSKRGEVYV